MKQVEERYISLLTDFGFKRIFGTAMNKDLLICFLNSLFNGKQVVKDVSYLNPEHVGDVYTDRRAIFDVCCEGENGEKFIVEMQNAYQTYFEDCALFYSTFPIREQAPNGNDWDFKLNHVYTVALLNFSMNEDAFDKGTKSVKWLTNNEESDTFVNKWRMYVPQELTSKEEYELI
jgi:predicted transposase/invertase (TIGR01784 family)